MISRRWSILALTTLACTVVAQAQTSQTSGAIRGTVRSKKAGAVVGANVIVRHLETGLTRTMVTDAKGTYLFNYLPVGVYEMTVQAPGLKTAKDPSVRVNLGGTTAENFDLDSATAEAVVEVVAAASGVDPTQVNTSTSIGEDLVEAVPINGRNFTDLVLLTPGAAQNSQGYRTSVDGARGIMNNLQIDGASFNSKFNGEQRGGTRIPFSFGQDSIRELQVITNAFDAQYGDASGAIVNAITKNGTNDISGGFMALFRPNSLVANMKPLPPMYMTSSSGVTTDYNAATNSALKRTFSQSQFAFNVGGPIIKDKLFYFVNVETVHYKQDNQPKVSFDKSGGTDQAYATFWGQGGMGATLITANNGATLGQESSAPWTDDIKHTAAFARIDWNINAANRAVFRLNAQTYKGLNDVYSRSYRTTTAQSNNSEADYNTLSWVAELNTIISNNLVNEARVQIATERRPNTPNSTICSEVGVPSFYAGQYNRDPSGTDEFTTQVIDNLTWMQGDWTVKGGFDLQFLSFKNTYYPYQAGGWKFNTWDIANQWWSGNVTTSTTSSYYTQSYSRIGGTEKFNEKLFAGYLQSQYTGLMNKRLVLNLGLRYTREMWDNNDMANPLVQGLDHMPDNGSWDPRFGFALDVFGNSKTVIRGGLGCFSTSNVAQNASSAMMSNGQNTLTYKVPFTTANFALFSNGGVLGKDAIVQNNSMKPLSGAALANMPLGTIQLTLIDPKAKMAQKRTATLGVEQDIGNGWVLGVKGTYARYYNMQYWVNINLGQYNATTGGTVDPNSIYNDGYNPNYNHFSTSARPGRAIVRGRMLDLSGYGDVGLSKYDGRGRYKALILTADRRSDTGFGIKSSITLAKSEDNNSNERITAQSMTGNTSNPANPLACMARSDNDVALRGVLTAYSPAFWGFKASGTFSYTSGRPFTPIYYADVNGDGYYNDPTADGRNGMRLPYQKSLNLRISRPFHLAKKVQLEGIVEVYNPFNWANQSTTWTTVDTSASTPTNFIPNADFRHLNTVDANTREVQLQVKLKF